MLVFGTSSSYRDEIRKEEKGNGGTKKSKVMAMMTVEAMEMAARSRSLRWPEKDWVMTVMWKTWLAC